MSRIYLVDDHAIMRDGLRVVLETAGHEVIGEAAGPTPALADLGRLMPDVVLLDLRLGQRSGFELLAELQRRGLQLRVIVLTMSDQPRHVAEALRLGAWGYLLKGSASSEVLQAVETVAAGRRFLSPQAAEFAASVLTDGGVYDNLGLEPYFDAGHGVPKHTGMFILVSDAGAPLPTGFAHGVMNPWRLKRVADIMSEQARALRVRTFVSYLQRAPGAGGYVYIGAPGAVDGSVGNCQHPALFPTTLRRLSFTEFDRLADHGYLVAKAVADECAMRSSANGPEVAEAP